jgi:hypothetical protein
MPGHVFIVDAGDDEEHAGGQLGWGDANDSRCPRRASVALATHEITPLTRSRIASLRTIPVSRTEDRDEPR